MDVFTVRRSVGWESIAVGVKHHAGHVLLLAPRRLDAGCVCHLPAAPVLLVGLDAAVGVVGPGPA